MTPMTINRLLGEFSAKKIKILVRPVKDSDLVLIEGDSRALTALGRLFVAIASKHGNHIQISPTMAGSKLFKRGSTGGLYVSCASPMRNKRARAGRECRNQ